MDRAAASIVPDIGKEGDSGRDKGRLGSQHSGGSEEDSPTKEEEIVEPVKEEDAISIAHSHASTISKEDHTAPPTEPPPRPTSIITPAVAVDRKDRRGLFATLTILPEVTNPYDYARPKKWLITITVAVAGAAAPMGSAIVMPVLGEISSKFHATPTVSNMSVAVYMLAMSIFPLWWSSFSETMGRRSIYIVSFTLFVIWGILSAVSTNIAMLIVMRTLSGGAAASVQAVGAGTIADVWEVKERGRAMGLFYLGPLCGPLFAPIIGGALGQGLGWRSTQWFLVIYGGVTLILIIFCLPETLNTRRNVAQEAQREAIQRTTSKMDTSEKQVSAPQRPAPISRVSTRQSVQIKTKTYMTVLRRILIDPLIVITWLRYPPIALTVYNAAMTFGSLYFLNISLQDTFAKSPYNFSTLILGLLYIPNSLGYILSSIFGGRWIDRIMHREARKAGRYDENGKLIFRPEDRMKENAWLACILWPGALIWYGWTAEKGVFWLVPMIANFFFGIGSMLIFSLSTTMLTEFMPKRASAGIAINNFVRNIFSFTAAVVAEPIISAIGNGWICTILGLWSMITGAAVLWAMRVKGEEWRQGMLKAGLGGGR